MTITNTLPFKHKSKHDIVKKNLKTAVPIILIQLVLTYNFAQVNSHLF